MNGTPDIPGPPTSLTVLVADDNRANRALLTGFLKKLGHRVLEAESGEQAIALFQQQATDMVLMDIDMPGMGGYEAVRELRRLATEWLPIIFISALGESESIVRSIESGGDEYLGKPVDLKLLRAKIVSLQHRLLLTRQLAQQNQLLLDYQAKNREEQAAAQEFMRHMSELDKINDPRVQYYLRPTEDFSGDLIAVARTPGNQLHVMLGDSTGHGLTAALAGMPVLQLFRSLTAKGFSIGGVAAEINNRIKRYMPANRYVAAILLSLDEESRMLSVWNGGCPPAVLLNPDGIPAYQFDSKHLPLGIVGAEQFDSDVERYCYGNHHCQLLMTSDGAVDAVEHAGMLQGMVSLLNAARGKRGAMLLLALLQLLGEKLGGEPQMDDIAMILVDCPDDNAISEALAGGVGGMRPRPQTTVARPAGQNHQGDETALAWQFSLTLTAPQLRNADIVPMVLDVVKGIESEFPQLSSTLFLVLSELVNNALEHGLLQLDSSLKHDPEGMERYFEERTARLKKLAAGEIRIKLSKEDDGQQSLLKVTVANDGAEFDYRAALAASPDGGLRRHGRGIQLVRNLSTRFDYDDNGRKANVCLLLKDAAPSADSAGQQRNTQQEFFDE